MKTGLTLKFLLKATAACVVLTVVDILLDHFTGIHLSTARDMKGVLAWIVLGIAWILYLVERILNRRKGKEKEPWQQTEKDPW